jgi:lysyl-tRNA synthetase class II
MKRPCSSRLDAQLRNGYQFKMAAFLIAGLLCIASLNVQPGWTANRHYHRSKTLVQSSAKKATTAKTATTAASNLPAVKVAPNDLLKAPEQFLNKNVTFEGTFNSFSSIGLDYKKAMKSSKDYVSILIRRPDVTDHTIPLSELKMFFPRKKSESVMTLESGDIIKITGQVFSTALSEPWLEVSEVKVIQKIKTPAKNKECIKDEC